MIRHRQPEQDYRGRIRNDLKLRPRKQKTIIRYVRHRLLKEVQLLTVCMTAFALQAPIHRNP
ncbi:MAG: hypothetical protein JWP44_4425 [Mucilaginibacter sp.]|nr:hypothetical protein [Mucilaginibacter sp.]